MGLMLQEVVLDHRVGPVCPRQVWAVKVQIIRAELVEMVDLVVVQVRN